MGLVGVRIVMERMGTSICAFLNSLLIVISLGCIALAQMDPHGPSTKGCQVCHFKKEKKLELKSNIPQRCILCHGKLPHSGVMEHVGKKLSAVKKGEGEVTCLSCHFPHREALKGETRLKEFKELESRSSFLKVKKGEGALPSGLIEKRNFETAMLRLSCTGCHIWK